MELPPRKATVIVASFVLLAALMSLWVTFRSPSSITIDRTPIVATYTGIGEVLAEEAIKLVHDHGNLVLVTDYDHAHTGRGRDDCWEAFHRKLQKHNAIRIIATEIVPYDPSEPDAVPGRCSSASFKRILELHSQATAIVFFIDLPESSRVESVFAQPRSVKIIAVNTGKPAKRSYVQYFTGGILSSLIGLRSTPDSATSISLQTPREWFDKYYQVYTPQNYESLPE